MKVTPVKTPPIEAGRYSIAELIDEHVGKIKPQSVVAITSKAVSLCEGAVVKIGEVDKQRLVAEEADYLLPRSQTIYGVDLTIKSNIMIANAGIDESNGNGYHILWPRDPQSSANGIRRQLEKRAGGSVGVVITDSRVTFMRRGTIGVALAHSGFAALKNYIDSPDIFGRKMAHTLASVVDGLAASAVLAMGEGSECTPIAFIEDIPFVNFQNADPTQREQDFLRIDPSEDLFGDLLKSIEWEKRPKD